MTRTQTNPRCPVIKTLWPGQPGTLKLHRRHGDALLCVRYRTDAEGRLRYTTVELVVEQEPLRQRLRAEDTPVSVPIRWDEDQLRQRAKAMGARWDPSIRRWTMPLRVARTLGIADRAELRLP